MGSKTKEFQLAEEQTFKNEIIHFFNINAINSTINIYLEIDGKRIKSEKSKQYFHKLILKDIGIKNNKKEIKCIIVDDAELKILIRIINKYKSFLKKKSKSFHKKLEELNLMNTTPRKNTENMLIKPSMSIRDKIKIFSGEFLNRQLNDKIIPGRLIMPKIFENEPNTDKKDIEGNVDKKNSDIKVNNDESIK